MDLGDVGVVLLTEKLFKDTIPITHFIIKWNCFAIRERVYPGQENFNQEQSLIQPCYKNMRP